MFHSGSDSDNDNDNDNDSNSDSKGPCKQRNPYTTDSLPGIHLLLQSFLPPHEDASRPQRSTTQQHSSIATQFSFRNPPSPMSHLPRSTFSPSPPFRSFRPLLRLQFSSIQSQFLYFLQMETLLWDEESRTRTVFQGSGGGVVLPGLVSASSHCDKEFRGSDWSAHPL